MRVTCSRRLRRCAGRVSHPANDSGDVVNHTTTGGDTALDVRSPAGQQPTVVAAPSPRRRGQLTA
ncbi:hypothetical protein M8494_20170 [Serratia ureilytica]